MWTLLLERRIKLKLKLWEDRATQRGRLSRWPVGHGAQLFPFALGRETGYLLWQKAATVVAVAFAFYLGSDEMEGRQSEVGGRDGCCAVRKQMLVVAKWQRHAGGYGQNGEIQKRGRAGLRQGTMIMVR